MLTFSTESFRLREFAPESTSEASAFSFSGWGISARLPTSFEDALKKMQDDALKQAAWFVEHSRLKHELVCSCWYGSKMESDAMWKLYCDRVGVAVTTTVSRLKAAVKCYIPKLFANHFKLSLARVTYDDTDYCKNAAPWLIKRNAFRHEHEVRLYVDYPYARAPGFELFIDTDRLIKTVTVTPYAKKWQSEVIEATMKRLVNRSGSRRLRLGGNPKIIQSDHLVASEPSWPSSTPASFPFGAFRESDS